jgi:hypothetical protein
MSEVTRILSAIEHGDPQAAEQLLPLVYDELRRLAAQKLAQEKPGKTLRATALVHEAYLRLVDKKEVKRWDSRGHFFAATAEDMRRILVERARRKGRNARRVVPSRGAAGRGGFAGPGSLPRSPSEDLPTWRLPPPFGQSAAPRAAPQTSVGGDAADKPDAVQFRK